MKWYYLLFIVLALSSCDEAVDLDDFNNNQEQLILINGAISPQDNILKVQVSRTTSSINEMAMNDADTFAIADATVLLSNSQRDTVVLSYVAQDFNYQIAAAQLAIRAGETYNLIINVDGKTYTSSCEIPLNNITQVDHQFTENLNEDGDLKPAVSISFNDISGASNHYIIGGQLEDFIIPSALDFEQRRFATDQIQDGGQLSAFGFFTIEDLSTVTDIKLQVANVAPILYDNLFANYSNGKNIDNPFYEFIIPPNNIIGSNGYGVFAGFQIQEKVVGY